MDEVRPAAESSDSSLSPIPSPHSNGFRVKEVIRVAHPHDNIPGPDGVVLSQSAQPGTSNAKDTTTPDAEKVKKPRKKRETIKLGKSFVDKPPTEKKTRKPRASNPDAPATSSRKKPKIEESTSAAAQPYQAPQQPTITQMLGQFQAPSQPASSSQTLSSKQTAAPREHLAPLPTPNSAVPRPASSGQRYDPIRGMTIEAHPPPLRTPPLQSASLAHRASASPSVSSLMNPTSNIPAAAAPTSNPQSPSTNFRQSETNILFPSSAPTKEIDLTTASPTSRSSQFSAQQQRPQMDGAMDLDDDHHHHPSLIAGKSTNGEESKSDSKPGSNTATPKAQRPTPPAAKPPGKGLLAASDLFGGPSPNNESRERHGVNIEISIKLNPMGGNTINMAQEIMKKYGLEAMNPREAARREQRAQIEAAAAKLEPGIGDDMSVDLSDADNDSNTEMGGVENGDDAKKPKKRRARKQEEYDQEDDFIDDTELAWEQQAAVAKDGFFVYSGPLVKPDEKPTIDGYVVLTLFSLFCNMLIIIQSRPSNPRSWSWPRPWSRGRRNRCHTRHTRGQDC